MNQKPTKSWFKKKRYFIMKYASEIDVSIIEYSREFIYDKLKKLSKKYRKRLQNTKKFSKLETDSEFGDFYVFLTEKKIIFSFCFLMCTNREMEECCVCYNPNKFKLECSHSVCLNCWLRMYEKNISSCPYCRTEMYYKNDRLVYFFFI